jgi:excisionase family DNA binding protein
MIKKEYLTLKEAGAIVGLSYSSLRKLIKLGKLKALRPSWKLVIARADLDAFMQASAIDNKLS